MHDLITIKFIFCSGVGDYQNNEENSFDFNFEQHG